MLKPKLLHSYVQSSEWYNDLYDKMTKEQEERYETFIREIGFNPTPERLQEFKYKLIELYYSNLVRLEKRYSFVRKLVKLKKAAFALLKK